jgi:succinate-acetate transporter protein
MGLICLFFAIASLRTNVAFFLVLLLLVPDFPCLAGAFWYNALGDEIMGAALQHAGGGLSLVLSLVGWYILLSLILSSVDFPLELPLGDLSARIKAASDITRVRDTVEEV